MANRKNTRRPSGKGNFHLEFKNEAQGLAWAAFKQQDVLFLLGPAGVGKTFLSCAFAIEQVLSKERKKIVLTRPIVESGESLGYLPGEFEDKIHPYMMPMYDCIDKLVGTASEATAWRRSVMESLERVPLAFMRGRHFDDAICILDEAQNATLTQLKLFLTRFGENSKLIISGDPSQTDIPGNNALVNVVEKLKPISGIGVVEFKSKQIVRHPLVGKMLEKLDLM